jgi:hypothetical protein
MGDIVDMTGTERVRVNVFAPGDPESLTAAEAGFAAAASVGRNVNARGTVPLSDVLVIGSVATNALVYLANTLRKGWRKGVVIDAIGDNLTIRQDPALPRGMVVLRSRSGEVTVRDGIGLADAISSGLPVRGGNGASEGPGSA